MLGAPIHGRDAVAVEGADQPLTADLAEDEEPIGLTIQYATIIITMAPITLLYPFLQRYFVKGLLIGSIKG